MSHRQIVLDTETTGLQPTAGHRVIEIGCIELIERTITGRQFHCYLNPEREIDAGAQQVHGLTQQFLADKPRFAEVSVEFMEFVSGAELIIHNAPFDLAFLDNELQLLANGSARVSDACSVIDTLVMARQTYPGQKNNLDALCKRLGIDNSQRILHGALLDARILTDVYLLMTGGQTTLFAAETVRGQTEQQRSPCEMVTGSQVSRAELVVVRANAAELAAHEAQVAEIAKSAGVNLWQEVEE